MHLILNRIVLDEDRMLRVNQERDFQEALEADRERLDPEYALRRQQERQQAAEAVCAHLCFFTKE